MMQDAGSARGPVAGSAVLAGEIVAAGWMRTPLLDNLELAEVTSTCTPSTGVAASASRCSARVEAEARARGRRVLTGLVGWTYDAGSDGDGRPGPGFARARGYDLALSEVQRELRLPVDEAAARAARGRRCASACGVLPALVGGPGPRRPAPGLGRADLDPRDGGADG